MVPEVLLVGQQVHALIVTQPVAVRFGQLVAQAQAEPQQDELDS